MRYYSVPRDLRGEEKIFGGILSLRQVIYLILGAGTGLGVLVAFWGMPLWLRAVIALSLLVAGGLLAFGKIDEDPADSYLAAAAAYLLRPNVYVWNGMRQETKERSGSA